MKEIQLSVTGKNKGKYVALVDDEDFEYLNKFNWYVAKRNNIYYAARDYFENNIKKQIRLHNQIMNSLLIDHLDHDGLNCQKYNMRYCTKSQNSMNQLPRKISTSKYKGVNFEAKLNKFRCRIRIDGKQHYLGIFENEIDAAKVYDIKAKELFGEFAYLNFPDYTIKNRIV